MTYIKDLISIPEHVGKGDFVLRLAEGVTDPEGTVKHYQVTPQLVKCFDEALKLVKGAVEGTSSKAASAAVRAISWPFCICFFAERPMRGPSRNLPMLFRGTTLGPKGKSSCLFPPI